MQTFEELFELAIKRVHNDLYDQAKNHSNVVFNDENKKYMRHIKEALEHEGFQVDFKDREKRLIVTKY